ncbi:hypothetical protein ALI144C_17245 [Actinosynnema sp. ALI-1.44]|uniref:LmeA family phospholipid-binding protein n=1 Tax=Actinosynnema sp. ALI-1.44 TaxID=1933779 RepID=UPI00097BF5F9|nr:LmeA family phospholipid-binding protein [Actinosynnema sp. ALI-1.44]ONI82819.1 hypothetical protein ALI144C_17245 [Actinosynnema sp. ALI-1.44]
MTWPWRELEGLLAAGKALVSGSPAAVLQAAVRAAGDRVVGRELTVRVGDADVTLTPVEIDAEVDPVGLALGQVPGVWFLARDVAWPGTPVHRLAITASDLRFQSLPSPSVMAGDVDVAITLTADVVRAKVAEVQPDLVVDIDHDSVMRVRWARRRTWGHLEVEPVVVEQGVHLRPKALQLGSMRVRGVERLRPALVEIPDLPRGLRLTGIDLGAGELVLRGQAERWHEKIPLTDLLTWLATTAATLTLPQFPGRDNAG